MTDADALFREGDLDGARAALITRVKASPDDVPTRMFLFQLLAIAGEWAKARAQLNTIAQFSPEAQMLAVAYGQAIDAERQRAIALAGLQPVPVLARGGDWIDGIVAALGQLGRGELQAAVEQRDAALDSAPDTPGTLEADGIDPVSFDWLADSDPWFGPSLEAIIGGKWGLLPFDALEWIKSAGARDLRDTVWFPVEIGLRSGPSVAAFLPARYPGSDLATDIAQRLGQATDWADDGRGIGQHVLITSAGVDIGLVSLRQLRFAAPI